MILHAYVQKQTVARFLSALFRRCRLELSRAIYSQFLNLIQRKKSPVLPPGTQLTDPRIQGGLIFLGLCAWGAD